MKTEKIKLGYETPSGKEVYIDLSHLIVTGITQLSGKTTTLEALINRSQPLLLKAIVFKTKRGEKSFSTGHQITPFFKNRSDYEFVRSLIESYSRERLSIEKGSLMDLCKGTSRLEDIKEKVSIALEKKKIRGIEKEIYTRLGHYLDNLIPQIKEANLSTNLSLHLGVNIMNLESFSDELQSLIIQAVADEVLNSRTTTVIVIPEAWKFLPQKRNNPCKRAVEALIRQGAANNNFVWIDSQDMAGVDKTPLKQISSWILGYQAERNEVKHTLDQIPLPPGARPAVDEVMKLHTGHFYLADRHQVLKVYVQPSWMPDRQALDVAKGKISVPAFPAPAAPETPSSMKTEDTVQLLKQMIEQLGNTLKGIPSNINVNEVAEKVVERIDLNELAKRVAPLLPAAGGSISYQVSPLEMIKKEFLQEIKNKIISDITELKPEYRKVLRYIEASDNDITNNEIVTKCLLLKTGGATATKVSGIFTALLSIDVIQKTKGGRYRKGLRDRISTLMGNHNATNEEIDLTYNHIIAELLTVN